MDPNVCVGMCMRVNGESCVISWKEGKRGTEEGVEDDSERGWRTGGEFKEKLKQYCSASFVTKTEKVRQYLDDNLYWYYYLGHLVSVQTSSLREMIWKECFSLFLLYWRGLREWALKIKRMFLQVCGSKGPQCIGIWGRTGRIWLRARDTGEWVQTDVEQRGSTGRADILSSKKWRKNTYKYFQTLL